MDRLQKVCFFPARQQLHRLFVARVTHISFFEWRHLGAHDDVLAKSSERASHALSTSQVSSSSP